MTCKALIIVLPALLLSACAAQGDYPSLARRAVERESAVSIASPAPAPVAESRAVSEGLAARLAALIDTARTAHARFLQNKPRAESLAAAGSGSVRGSENWAVASIALAQLESARSDAMIALADLDALHSAERTSNFNEVTPDGAAISKARDAVIDLVGQQDMVLAGLRGRLGG